MEEASITYLHTLIIRSWKELERHSWEAHIRFSRADEGDNSARRMANDFLHINYGSALAIKLQPAGQLKPTGKFRNKSESLLSVRASEAEKAGQLIDYFIGAARELVNIAKIEGLSEKNKALSTVAQTMRIGSQSIMQEMKDSSIKLNVKEIIPQKTPHGLLTTAADVIAHFVLEKIVADKQNPQIIPDDIRIMVDESIRDCVRSFTPT